MAELNQNLIKFGWLTAEEMHDAIQNGNLDAYDVCYTKDTHEQYLINSQLEPVAIKSRVKLYSSVEKALADVQESTDTYAGELISVRDGEKFIAYIVNQFDDGTYYIAPVCSDGMIDYNKILNVPMKNIEGTYNEPIYISQLPDGKYNVLGYFILPDGIVIHSIVGNIFSIESEDVDTKTIKRINNDSIIDYTVSDGNVNRKEYITDEYLEINGYTTKNYVDSSLAALDCVTHKELEDYVAITCTLLIKHLLDDELDLRYSSAQDIMDLFD